MGGGSSAPSKTTTTNALDPNVARWTQNNYNVAQGIANQQYSPYTGEMVAPLNSTQWQGINQGTAAAAANTGMGALNQGVANATAAGQYQPQQVSTGTWNQQAAQQYMNPYTQSVINATNQQIDQNLAQTQANTNAQATTAGAYGGTRQAVQNAQNDYYANQIKAQSAAQLNDQAYTNAQNAFSTDQARQLQAAQANQQAGLNAANLGLGSADILNQLGLGQQALSQQNAQALLGYGSGLQQQQQNQDQWNYQNYYLNPQQWPERGLSALESAVSGIPYSTTSTSSQQNYSNPFAGALGGAASGAAVGTAINPGVGTAVGAGIGGLLGIFGA